MTINKFERIVFRINNQFAGWCLHMENAVIKKLNIRILLFLMICYFVSILDRANISVASLTMNEALNFSPSVYGFGASIFFIGYFLFEVPSNLIMGKVGAPRWIGRIMVTWGVVTAAMIFINSSTSFFTMRLLLGIAEAGFYPGVIYYLSQFYPSMHRTKAIGLFQIASPVALMIGTPLIGMIANLHGLVGLQGWQLIFLFTGIPAVVLGVICFIYLKPSIKQLKWLTKEEQKWLTTQIENENKSKPFAYLKFYQIFSKPQVWLATFILFAINVGFNGVAFWTPQIIKSIGTSSDLIVSVLSGIPYFVAAVSIILISRHSDKTGERKLHIVFCLLASALGFFLSSITSQPVIMLIALSIATAGLLSAMPPLWTYPTSMFSGVAAATAIATINSFGVLGGIVGPNIIGFMTNVSGSLSSGLLVVTAILFAGGISAFFLKSSKGNANDSTNNKNIPFETNNKASNN
ncbi:MFS transporter [Priestia megaterium]